MCVELLRLEFGPRLNVGRCAWWIVMTDRLRVDTQSAGSTTPRSDWLVRRPSRDWRWNGSGVVPKCYRPPHWRRLVADGTEPPVRSEDPSYFATLPVPHPPPTNPSSAGIHPIAPTHSPSSGGHFIPPTHPAYRTTKKRRSIRARWWRGAAQWQKNPPADAALLKQTHTHRHLLLRQSCRHIKVNHSPESVHTLARLVAVYWTQTQSTRLLTFKRSWMWCPAVEIRTLDWSLDKCGAINRSAMDQNECHSHDKRE